MVLPAPLGPEQPDDLALAEPDRDPVHHAAPAIALGELAPLEHAGRSGRRYGHRESAGALGGRDQRGGRALPVAHGIRPPRRRRPHDLPSVGRPVFDPAAGREARKHGVDHVRADRVTQPVRRLVEPEKRLAVSQQHIGERRPPVRIGGANQRGQRQRQRGVGVVESREPGRLRHRRARGGFAACFGFSVDGASCTPSAAPCTSTRSTLSEPSCFIVMTISSPRA